MYSYTKGMDEVSYPEDNTYKIVETSYLRHNPNDGYVKATIGIYRKGMEDNRSCYYRDGIKIYAVYDGHGGYITSLTAAKDMPNFIYAYLITVNLDNEEEVRMAIKAAIIDFDSKLFNSNGRATMMDGSTMTMVIIINDKIYFVNTGDSRTIFCNDKLIFETVDHKPTDETESNRIFSSGNFVANNRVNGILAVSRGLGDFKFKRRVSELISITSAVSPEPDITVMPVTSGNIILASDGLWDVMTSQEAALISSHAIAPRFLAKNLVDISISRSSMDNVTVMVIPV